MSENNNSATAPELYLIKTGEEIILNQEVFSALGNPHYIQFLWDRGKAVFAVQAFKTRMRGCYAKEELYAENDMEIFHSPTLVNGIWASEGFRDNCVYRISGSSDPRLNRINFDLREAEICGASGH